jgi:hypothetical protein
LLCLLIGEDVGGGREKKSLSSISSTELVGGFDIQEVFVFGTHQARKAWPRYLRNYGLLSAAGLSGSSCTREEYIVSSIRIPLVPRHDYHDDCYL